ncbi:MAG: hypothetical protein HC806_06315, partial [Anaerolineae bacterium]|nr:hypothetical protein [Anaerolineae bacterium]
KLIPMRSSFSPSLLFSLSLSFFLTACLSAQTPTPPAGDVPSPVQAETTPTGEGEVASNAGTLSDESAMH